jgi:hypothetical protein
VSALANSLKNVSARRELDVHARALLVPSYLAVSRGGAAMGIVGQYIDQQRPA